MFAPILVPLDRPTERACDCHRPRPRRENDVDLIILGSQKIDPARPGQGWGTTSYKVGILCRCPVLLVK